MQHRIVVTLEPNEAAALVDDAQANLRHPREHLRFILRQELIRRGLLPADGTVATDEVYHVE